MPSFKDEDYMFRSDSCRCLQCAPQHTHLDIVGSIRHQFDARSARDGNPILSKSRIISAEGSTLRDKLEMRPALNITG